MILIFWILVAFFLSSIPWAMVLGFLFLNRDIREVGDNNYQRRMLSQSKEVDRSL